ncbi:MAG: TIGR03915 family putative DNA repair protein [Bacillota bacterium]
MTILIAENNLAGLLTAVYEYYYHHKEAKVITSDPDKVTMLDNKIIINTCPDKANKVRQGIIKKINNSGYKEVCDAYRNCDKEKEQKIFEFLKLAFEKGKQAFDMYHNPVVIAFNDLLKKVRHEQHRMYGFIRFKELKNGVFYACFSSDHDILELIIGHFKSRFNIQPFILHDIKRKKLAFYDGKKIHFLLAHNSINIELGQNEALFSELWKEYNQNVSIDNRQNTKLQNQFVPKKYRWFMNEF